MAILFERDDIVAAIDELVDLLGADHTTSHIRIVGGAALALHVLRATSTTDVDALYAGNPAVDQAARTIAHRRGWPEDWLNDRAKIWASHLTTDQVWVQFSVRGDVVVSIASVPLLLAMKLRAARGARDSKDIDVLLDECGVTDTAAAFSIYERYYPEDPLPQRALAQLEGRFGRH